MYASLTYLTSNIQSQNLLVFKLPPIFHLHVFFLLWIHTTQIINKHTCIHPCKIDGLFKTHIMVTVFSMRSRLHLVCLNLPNVSPSPSWSSSQPPLSWTSSIPLRPLSITLPSVFIDHETNVESTNILDMTSPVPTIMSCIDIVCDYNQYVVCTYCP